MYCMYFVFELVLMVSWKIGTYEMSNPFSIKGLLNTYLCLHLIPAQNLNRPENNRFKF